LSRNDYKKRTAQRLIIYIILFSSLITLFITAVQLYGEYRRDIDGITRHMDQIRSGYLLSVAEAVWVADHKQLQTLLDGIRKMPDIEHAQVSVDGESYHRSGAPVDQQAIVFKETLYYQHRGKQIKIGEFRVDASLRGVYRRLITRAGIILLSNTVKTFFVALFIYFLFKKLVTRHLDRIAEYAHSWSAGQADAPLQLDRKPGRDMDELDTLVVAINRMSENIVQSFLALRESDERFRTLARLSPVGIFHTDAAGACIYVNERLCELAGIPAEQAHGEGWAKALHPEDRERVFREWTEAVRSQQPFRTECRFKRPDGKAPWLLVLAEEERDNTDNVIGYVGSVTDISAQKRTEATISQVAAGVSIGTGEAFFQQLMQNLANFFNADIAYLGLLDEKDNNRVNTCAVWARDRAMDNFSYSLEGTPCAKVVEQTTCFYSSGVREEFPDDRTLIDMNIDSFIGTPLFDSTGMPIGLIVALNSKTVAGLQQVRPVMEIFAARAAAEMERVQTEQALNRSISEWNYAMDYFEDAITLTDMDGKIIRANRTYYRLTGLSPEEVIGRDDVSIMHPHQEDPTCPVHRARRAHEDTQIRMEADHPDNPFGWPIDVTVKVIRDKNGLPQSIMTATHDLRRQRALEDELRKHRDNLEDLVAERTTELKEVNQELEAFSYSISHDLRTPLRAIDGFAQVLAEDYQEVLDDTAKHHLRRVRAASQRMGDLIDDILELCQLSRSVFKPTDVDLSVLAESAIGRLCEAEPGRKVDVSIAPGVWATGDQTLLGVAMDNLIGNAWKYTAKTDAACIEFGVTEKDDERVFFVRDNGAGFDMQYADKLFGVFQRMHKAEEFEGTGIGLATVQRIVHRHGGRIWAEAETNQGAVFYFTLPG